MAESNVARLREPASDDGVVWEEPPRRGRGPYVNLQPRLDALRRRPNTWARIVEYPSPSAASYRRKLVEADESMDEFEFRSAGFGDKGSALWARWIGDGSGRKR